MRKIILLLVSFLAIIIASYSALWFYQSEKVKSLAENFMVEAIKRIGGSKSGFVYSRSSVSGYPFSFNVKFSEPKMIIDDKGVFLEVKGREDFVVRSNITSTIYNILPPENIIITDVASRKRDVWHIIYNDPKIYLKLKPENILSWMMGHVAGSGGDLLVKAEEFSYIDSGYKLTDVATDEVVSSIGKSFVNLKFNGASEGSVDIMLDVKQASIDTAVGFATNNNNLGDTDIEADISYIKGVDGEYLLSIRKFNFSSENFKIDASGNVENLQSEPLPVGIIKVKLGNYSGLIDFGQSVVNYVVQRSAFPIFTINNEQSASFKEFISTIAAEKYNNDRDVFVTIKRDKGADVQFGRYGLYEALQILKGNYALPGSPGVAQ